MSMGKPMARYAAAKRVGDFVFMSGVVAVHPATRRAVSTYEELPEAAIAGWVFPRKWVFRHNDLLNVLFGLRDTRRVKGVFHTDSGWIFFNATRFETAVNSEPARGDSRVEVIAAQALDWPALESAMLACRQPD